MLNNSIFSKQDAKLLRHKNRQKILTPPTEKTPPYRYRDSAATHRKHIPKRGQGSTIHPGEGANTSTCTTHAGGKSKAGEMWVGGAMGGRGPAPNAQRAPGSKGKAREMQVGGGWAGGGRVQLHNARRDEKQGRGNAGGWGMGGCGGDPLDSVNMHS